MRIFSLLILFQFSASFGQTLSLKIDENMLMNQHTDSLNYVLSEELSKRGYFGGKLEFVDNDPEKLTYTFLNETKVIDELLFNPCNHQSHIISLLIKVSVFFKNFHCFINQFFWTSHSLLDKIV